MRAACGRPFINSKQTGDIMFGFGHWEILIVLVIALIIFGAGKLPEIGSGIGNAIRNFKKGVAEVEKEEPEKIEAANNS
jgi:sec-independent protein translocase protein TatA